MGKILKSNNTLLVLEINQLLDGNSNSASCPGI